MDALWGGLGVAAVVLAVLGGFALIVWAERH